MQNKLKVMKENIPFLVLYMSNKQIDSYYKKISSILKSLNFADTGIIEENKWWTSYFYDGAESDVNFEKLGKLIKAACASAETNEDFAELTNEGLKKIFIHLPPSESNKVLVDCIRISVYPG